MDVTLEILDYRSLIALQGLNKSYLKHSTDEQLSFDKFGHEFGQAVNNLQQA